jgi:alpha-beta hydrolase superfamily lysophospholipase
MVWRVSWRHVALFALGVTCAVKVTNGVAASHRVSLRTEDGVTLAATWYEPSSRGGPAVVLVHMLHRSRRDWDGVASRLASEGIGAVAIDLRGHGESQGSAAVEDLSRMALDVRAARRFLSSRSDTHGPVGLAGASLGASLAALEASTDSTIASVALLSPSLEYRGLRIEAALRKYGDRPAFLVAGDDDPYAARSVRELQKAGGGTRETLLLSRAGHGTTMLSRDPELTRRLVDWFRRTLL